LAVEKAVFEQVVKLQAHGSDDFKTDQSAVGATRLRFECFGRTKYIHIETAATVVLVQPPMRSLVVVSAGTPLPFSVGAKGLNTGVGNCECACLARCSEDECLGCALTSVESLLNDHAPTQFDRS
jgi:hypothetical protein